MLIFRKNWSMKLISFSLEKSYSSQELEQNSIPIAYLHRVLFEISDCAIKHEQVLWEETGWSEGSCDFSREDHQEARKRIDKGEGCDFKFDKRNHESPTKPTNQPWRNERKSSTWLSKGDALGGGPPKPYLSPTPPNPLQNIQTHPSSLVTSIRTPSLEPPHLSPGTALTSSFATTNPASATPSPQRTSTANSQPTTTTTTPKSHSHPSTTCTTPTATSTRTTLAIGDIIQHPSLNSLLLPRPGRRWADQEARKLVLCECFVGTPAPHPPELTVFRALGKDEFIYIFWKVCVKVADRVTWMT